MAPESRWSLSRISGLEHQSGHTKEKWWWVGMTSVNHVSSTVPSMLGSGTQSLILSLRPALLSTTGGQWSWMGRRNLWGRAMWPSRTSAPTQSTRPAGPVSHSAATAPAAYIPFPAFHTPCHCFVSLFLSTVHTNEQMKDVALTDLVLINPIIHQPICKYSTPIFMTAYKK